MPKKIFWVNYCLGFEMQENTRDLSEKIFTQSSLVIPGGVNSPIRNFKQVRTLPLIAQSANEDCLLDVDGNTYIDYCMSWGALILGHAPKLVVTSLQKQIQEGTTFGVSTPHELAIAKKIVDLIPSIEKIRFVNSGTEATMSAIRLARAYTNKDLIVKFDGNYHGHHDSLLMQSGSYLSKQAFSKGVPLNFIETTVSLPFNDIDALHTFFTSKEANRVAAVILEPVSGNMGVIPAEDSFLQTLKEYSLDRNFLLIFDEVITGFRLSLQGAQGLYQIEPDLTCLGKIIGGGLPAAAIGGASEIMNCFAPDGEVFQAGTLSGNPLAMKGGLATLQLLETKGVYQELEKKTKRITDPIQKAFIRHEINACVQSVGSMFSVFWGIKQARSKKDVMSIDQDKFMAYFRFLFERGIYIPQSPYETSFVSLAHTKKHLEYTRDVILEFIAKDL